MERTRLHSTDGVYSLQVHLNPGLYPGISLDYTTNDWRAYGILSFDIFLIGDSSLEIILRINDREHNNKYVDRFNRSLVLHPGANHIFIKLDEVKMAPQGRKMDMANITNICIFAYKLNKPRTVYFDNFRLEK
jgi:hypothetical protein